MIADITDGGLVLERVTKSFGRNKALADVSFGVPQGGFVVLLGAAGAGKTTTMRLVAGLEEQDAGRIRLGSRVLDGLEPKDRDVAMIFDNLALYPDRSGFENIAHPLRLRRLDQAAITAKVEAVAAKLKIAHVMHRLPKTMSGGERQRVALGRALVRDPALYLLDEPLSSLDAMLRVELRAELRRIQREAGATFLLATPDFVEALEIADTIVMLVEGTVRQVGTPAEIYAAPADRDVARFVGAPEINLVAAGFDPSEGGRVRLLDTVLPAAPALCRLLDRPAALEVGLRPEDIAVGPPAEGLAHAAITDIEQLGTRAALTLVASGGTEIRATLPSAEARVVRVGERVGLAPRPERLLAFDPDSGLRVA